jgi:F-type H+-transporting ATPase subunit epsilon
LANTYQAQLLTPEGSRFDGQVVSVRVPGSNGDFQMLYNHAPIVSSLGIGKISIKQEGGNALNFAVSGGFVEMSDNQLTILAEKAEKSSEINREEALKLRDEIKERLESLDYRSEDVENELAIAENRLKIADS